MLNEIRHSSASHANYQAILTSGSLLFLSGTFPGPLGRGLYSTSGFSVPKQKPGSDNQRTRERESAEQSRAKTEIQYDERNNIMTHHQTPGAWQPPENKSM